jgi:hypothetical protein
MTDENERTKTHLSRLGVNPVVSARLVEWAEQDGMSLRELVRYVLTDYYPAADSTERWEPDGQRMEGGRIVPTDR